MIGVERREEAVQQATTAAVAIEAAAGLSARGEEWTIVKGWEGLKARDALVVRAQAIVGPRVDSGLWAAAG